MAIGISTLALSILLVNSATQYFNYYNQGADWGGTCYTGLMQSPIDFKSSEVIQIPNQSDLTTRLYPHLNTLKVEGKFGSNTFAMSGNWGYIESKIYDKSDSKQYWNVTTFQFHSPSEHRIQEKQYDLELQMKLSNQATGQIAWLAVMFENTDDQNSFLKQVIKAAGQVGEVQLTKALDGYDRIAEYYQYIGSNTQPTCDQGIIWLVWTRRQKMNSEQVKFFADKWENNFDFAGGNGNNREIQDSNYEYRNILLYKGDDKDYDDKAILLVAGVLFLVFNQAVLGKYDVSFSWFILGIIDCTLVGYFFNFGSFKQIYIKKRFK